MLAFPFKVLGLGLYGTRLLVSALVASLKRENGEWYFLSPHFFSLFFLSSFSGWIQDVASARFNRRSPVPLLSSSLLLLVVDTTLVAAACAADCSSLCCCYRSLGQSQLLPWLSGLLVSKRGRGPCGVAWEVDWVLLSWLWLRERGSMCVLAGLWSRKRVWELLNEWADGCWI